MTARPIVAGAVVLGAFAVGFGLGSLATQRRPEPGVAAVAVPAACAARLAALELRAFNVGRELDMLERAAATCSPLAPAAKPLSRAEAQGASSARPRARSSALRARLAGRVRR